MMNMFISKYYRIDHQGRRECSLTTRSWKKEVFHPHYCPDFWGRAEQVAAKIIISFFMCQRNCSECVSLLLRHEPTLEAKNEALVTAAKFGRDDYLCMMIFPSPPPFAFG